MIRLSTALWLAGLVLLNCTSSPSLEGIRCYFCGVLCGAGAALMLAEEARW